MKKIRKFFGKIFCLPPLWTAAIAIPCFTFAIVVAVLGSKTSNTLHVVSYVASAYAMIVTVVGLPTTVRAVREALPKIPVVRKIAARPLVARFLGDLFFRADISLYRGLTVNFLYAAFRFVFDLVYHSLRFAAVGSYYLVSGLIRLYLVRRAKKAAKMTGTTPKADEAAEETPDGTLGKASAETNENGVFKRENETTKSKSETVPSSDAENDAERAFAEKQKRLYTLRSCRNAGLMLLGLDAVVAGFMAHALHNPPINRYPDFVLYLSSFFTFYTLILAIVNLVKFRRTRNGIYIASKSLNFANALTSIFVLQVTFLSRFGSAGNFASVMNWITGATVFLLIAAIAVGLCAVSAYKIGKSKKSLSFPPPQEKEAPSRRQR